MRADFSWFFDEQDRFIFFVSVLLGVSDFYFTRPINPSGVKGHICFEILGFSLKLLFSFIC